MKKILLKFWHFFLSMQLAILPIHSWAISDNECLSMYSDSPTILESCQSCSQAPDKEWDSNLNTCKATEEAQAAREAGVNCYYGEENAASCFETVANNSLAEEGLNAQNIDKNQTGKIAGSVVLGAASLALTQLVFKKADNNCPHPSNALLVGAALAGVMGDVISPLYFALKSGSLNKQYKDYISNEKSVISEDEDAGADVELSGEGLDEANYDGQMVAFNYLIDSEKAKKTSYQIKMAAHGVAAGLYAAATVAGIVEISKEYYAPGSSACPVNPAAEEMKGKTIKTAITIIPIIAMGGMLFGSLSSQLKSTQATEESSSIETNQHPMVKVVSSGILQFQELLDFKYGWMAPNSQNKLNVSPSIQEYQTTSDSLKLVAFPKTVLEFIFPQAYGATYNYDSVVGSLGHLRKAAETCPNRATCDYDMQYGIDQEIDRLEEEKLEMEKAAKNDAIWRVFISGAGAILSGAMTGISASMAKRSQENIDTVTAIRDSFMASVANNCQNRNDASEPSCYCYLDDGTINAERMDDATCNAFLNSFAFGDSSEYANSILASGGGCIDSSGAWDASCECAQTTNQAGQTACMSINNPNLAMAVGNMDWWSTTASGMNSLSNGNYSGSDLDSANLLNAAQRAMKTSSSMLDQLDKKLAESSKGPTGIKDLQKKYLAATLLLGKKAAEAQSASSQLLALANPTENLPADAQAALKSVGAEIDKKVKFSSGGGTGKGENKKNPLLGFGAGKVQGKVLDDIMNKNFDIKGDINKNPDVSIWDTITHRYHQTGLRKLFDQDESK